MRKSSPLEQIENQFVRTNKKSVTRTKIRPVIIESNLLSIKFDTNLMATSQSLIVGDTRVCVQNSGEYSDFAKFS